MVLQSRLKKDFILLRTNLKKTLWIRIYVFNWFHFTQVSYFFFLYWSPSSSLCTIFDSISSNTYEVLLIKPCANLFAFGDFRDWLTYSGRIDELVNSVIIFLCQMNWLRWLIFLLGFLTVTFSQSCSFRFLSSDSIICSTMAFPLFGNFDHVVGSFSKDFPSNSTRDTFFHHITYDFSGADWDSLFMIIWEMFHGRISSNSVLLLLLVNFVRGFRLELMYIFLIVNIRSNFSHLHGFQLLVMSVSTENGLFWQQNITQDSKSSKTQSTYDIFIK